MDGWIAQLGSDEFSHCFGGSDWSVTDPNEIFGGPSLLLNLDLSDPRLGPFKSEELRTLPICSYINCDLWIEPQRYKFVPESNEVVLTHRSSRYTTVLEPPLSYENPLTKKPVVLRRMTQEELVTSESDYWKVCDTFLGGSSFIRILGYPLWLQRPENPSCSCGKRPLYVCSIGYDYPLSTGFTGERPFFIGEAALYFFFCRECREVVVLSQPT